VTTIQPIGRFYQTDQDRNLINECHVNNIPPFFRLDVDRVQKLCQQIIPENYFHSLYLRGSVPRGLASSNFSDIDVFAILDCDRDICFQYESQVRVGCLSIKRKVDFSVYTLAEVKLLPEWELAFVIKVNSLCLSGLNLIPLLPTYQPTKTVVAGYASVAERIERTKNAILQQPESAGQFCKWVAKYIVRTGLAICIERDSRYSPDLWPCYCVFSDWFPSHSHDMRSVLKLAIDDNPDVQVGLHLLDGFGQWIAHEASVRLS